MKRNNRGAVIVTSAPSGIGSVDGQTFDMLSLDVIDDGSVEAFANKVLQRSERLDMTLRNAGTGDAVDGGH